jgi:tripartite-type tricarboxylate transporter receptor subunit TctC
MMLARVFTLVGMLLAAFGIIGASTAGAQEWPTRPVRIIIPYGPGGIGDVYTRITADRLSGIFGKSFVVDARGGAAGEIGTEAVVRSAPDGYTLYSAGVAQFAVLPLMRKLPYDPVRDLLPISLLTNNGMAFAVKKDFPARTLREFIDYARANSGKINYGSTGLGASSQLAPALFAAREKLDMVVVPFTATPPSIVALLNGTTDLFFGNVADILGTAQAGNARILAFSTAARLPQYPDIPTVAETVPGFVFTAWTAAFAPVGTPRPIIDRLAAAIKEVQRDPEVVKRFSDLSVESISSSPEELAVALQRDLPIYRSAVEAAGLMRKE